MIPMAFIAGLKVIRWQKLAWLILIGVSPFLFDWDILDSEAEAFSALPEGRVVLAFGLVIAYALMTFGVWLYFLRTKRSVTG